MLYPQHKSVPQTLVTKQFLLRAITIADVELDYNAVMSSKDLLRRLFQSTWPADDFTLAANRKDLEHHVQLAEGREQFTYTMLNSDKTLCLGAVYVRPLRVPPPEWTLRTGDFPLPVEGEAAIDFWVTPSASSDNLDRDLVAVLLDWFDNVWDFPRVSYRTNENMPHQVEILQAHGLRERYLIKRPNNLPNRVIYSR
ncbi:MAG: hypothetical protein AAF639_06340 [Chloroflexota bacterium]